LSQLLIILIFLLKLGFLNGEAKALSNSASVFRITFVENLNLSFLNISSSILEVSSDVFNQMISINILHDLSEQGTRLSKVIIGVSGSISLDQTIDLEGSNGKVLFFSVRAKSVGFVVRSVSLVAIDLHETISLSVDHSASVRAVDGDLLVVDTESVSVGISIGEKSSLEHFVGRSFNTGDHMNGGEGGLFDFSEVVIGVSVKNHLTDFNQGIITMRPDLGDIENIPLILGGISFRHNLNLHAPGGGFARGNMVKQVSGSIITVLGNELSSFRSSEILDASVGLEVELDPETFVLFIDPLESVRAESVHVSVTIGGTSVGEEDSDLMGRFRDEGKEVPESIGVLAVGLGVSLLGVNEIREFGRVSDEENGGVVTNQIPVTFFSVELDGETSGISFGISRTLFTTNSGESSEDRSSLSNSVQKFGLAELGDVVSDFEVTVSTGTLGVDDSFGDSFSVETGELVDQIEILEEDWAVFSSGEGVLVVVNGSTVRGGHDGSMLVIVIHC
jgi:hypothetical protein